MNLSCCVRNIHRTIIKICVEIALTLIVNEYYFKAWHWVQYACDGASLCRNEILLDICLALTVVQTGNGAYCKTTTDNDHSFASAIGVRGYCLPRVSIMQSVSYISGYIAQLSMNIELTLASPYCL
jgi:hypothetical protein